MFMYMYMYVSFIYGICLFSALLVVSKIRLAILDCFISRYIFVKILQYY